MAIYGYARVSTAGQDLEIQEVRLRNFGCDIIRSEKMSGTSRQGREELETLLEFLRDGDTLVVTRIDRLARSVGDLQDILRELKSKNVRLQATDQPFDTGDIYGEFLLNILGCVSSLENQIRRERIMVGVKKAKERGVYKGRKQSIDREAVKALKLDGLGATAIAKKLGIGRASVYRVLSEQNV